MHKLMESSAYIYIFATHKWARGVLVQKYSIKQSVPWERSQSKFLNHRGGATLYKETINISIGMHEHEVI